MKSSCLRRRSAFLTFVRFGFAYCVLTCFFVAGLLLAVGCAPSQAFQTVASQNADNSTRYAANVATLAAAASELAHLESGEMIRRARERVSQDLTRLRSTITPSDPTEVELTDATAFWTRALIAEAAALATRVNIAAPSESAAVADSLAIDHPATIDLAIATPGFTPSRILRDANELDRINAAIEREPNANIRVGLLDRRDAILNNYLPSRNAATSAARFNAAIASLISTIDEQGRVLGLHASAVASTFRPMSGPPRPGFFRDPDLRAAILELIADTSGNRAAEQVREHLRRIDDAASIFETARR